MTGSVRERLLDAISERFRREFAGPPPRRFYAPGRINLVGAHLDYNGGDVLPMAVDRGLYVAVRLRTDGHIRLRSLTVERQIDVERICIQFRANVSLREPFNSISFNA